jgi:hypothetical protein
MKQKKNFLVYDILLLALTRRGQAFANCKAAMVGAAF